MTPQDPEITYEALRASMLRCQRRLPFRWAAHEQCPECGDDLLTVLDCGGVTDGEPAVCCDCRRVWCWSADEGGAWINDQRDHDEEQPFVTIAALARIRAEAEVIG
jgi:hypothetical protein